ncbi:sulfate reduction electron transfer complex DsrMKJOP subunit DsrP [Dehalobacterium formicoaceticum]|uniref:Polysulfide reductase NrfD n=1 Tax=Dehalobacterium formicoaceticum TaxID=51515 RepID=A0ABT1Y1X1_9FIRM|nr:NrfD/PsrC family molybdoenzyme membrane anchor subunit [Dehalobacterium formicoaceticum]MCR6544866.1 polysulfide reductase NrfD [Dehalobacterium formicoaceticum]
MVEHIFRGSKRYWLWLGFLAAVIAAGFAAYIYQFQNGLTVTNMGRDVSWGLYIGQFTFFVGVAASAVMVVLPYYLHNAKEFGKVTIFGEFLAISAVIMCLLFIIVDLGRPDRLFNVIIMATPHSMMFWDMVVLSGYLLINLLVGWNVLEAEYNSVSPATWVKRLAYLSIPWAVSIHTVTAFLISGLPGRHYWLTAIMAARFLASAFASGPSLLILLMLFLKKFTSFKVEDKVLNKLSVIITYALTISLFFIGLEFFTAFYSQVPTHMHTLQYLFVGLEGHTALVPFMAVFTVLALVAWVLLLNPKTRKNQKYLGMACAFVFVAMMIEKGLALIIGGFIPNTFERITEYLPSLIELMVTVGVWAIGALVLTILYKMAVAVKERAGETEH